MSEEELCEAIFKRDLKINKLKKKLKKIEELFDLDYVYDIINSYDSDKGISTKTIIKYEEIYRELYKKGIRE